MPASDCTSPSCRSSYEQMAAMMILLCSNCWLMLCSITHTSAPGLLTPASFALNTAMARAQNAHIDPPTTAWWPAGMHSNQNNTTQSFLAADVALHCATHLASHALPHTLDAWHIASPAQEVHAHAVQQACVTCTAQLSSAQLRSADKKYPKCTTRGLPPVSTDTT